MGYKTGRCKTFTPSGIFIVTPSLEGWPTKAKEAPSPHEVRLALLDTNPVCFELFTVASNYYKFFKFASKYCFKFSYPVLLYVCFQNTVLTGTIV